MPRIIRYFEGICIPDTQAPIGPYRLFSQSPGEDIFRHASTALLSSSPDRGENAAVRGCPPRECVRNCVDYERMHGREVDLMFVENSIRPGVVLTVAMLASAKTAISKGRQNIAHAISAIVNFWAGDYNSYTHTHTHTQYVIGRIAEFTSITYVHTLHSLITACICYLQQHSGNNNTGTIRMQNRTSHHFLIF